MGWGSNHREPLQRNIPEGDASAICDAIAKVAWHEPEHLPFNRAEFLLKVIHDRTEKH